MSESFDFVVAGGSVGGLSFAAEAAKRGASVLVAEEHPEIGEPEKCDGLVSLRGLKKYGYEPDREVIQSSIATAVIHSPDGRSFAINATGLEVVVLDRSAFDKQIASRAEALGATIRTGVRAGVPERKGGGVEVKVGDEAVTAKYFVNATGPAAAPREGILPAAKYEIEGDWVRERVVEVFADAEKYPGFFAWVIPYGGKKAKVGAAGFGISPFRALDSFLDGREHRVIRKISAPIYIGGPIQTFVDGRLARVGEAAGQVKPTTAGGIMTTIAGSVMAARWLCGSLEKENAELASKYQREWELAFLKEMKSMLRLRGVWEKLSNADIEGVFTALATPRVVSKLSRSDFDFHATALLGVLGVPGLLRVARVVASAEVRSLLSDN